MRLDGLFIDMYGTLTTGDRAAVEAVCELIVNDTLLPLTALELSVRWGERFFALLEVSNHAEFMTLFEVEARSLVDTMRRLGVAIDPEPYVRHLSAYWRSPPLQPEVTAFLQACPRPLCIVSNADRADLDGALRRHRIAAAHVVASEDVRAYKPDPTIFRVALERTGWDPARVMHVGDSLHSDVGGAQAAGLKTGWLNRAHRIHDIGNHTPDYEFADLMEVLAVLRQR